MNNLCALLRSSFDIQEHILSQIDKSQYPVTFEQISSAMEVIVALSFLDKADAAARAARLPLAHLRADFMQFCKYEISIKIEYKRIAKKEAEAEDLEAWR